MSKEQNSQSTNQEKIRRLHQFNKANNTPFMQKLRTVTNDNEMVTVQVPSAGGGLTNTQIPKTALEDYLYQQGREYDSNQKYIVYDPKIVDKAKQENPERFADPINNSLNWLMTGGAGLYRAAANGALSTAGKAATDLANKLSFSSTYQTGVGLAATPTTGAVIGDAAIATGTMIPVTNDISKNGLDLVNGTETALGLLPVVGPVYRNASIGAKNTKRAVDEFRLAREINKSARNTKLINKDIEVVSPIGVTEGAGLNTHSNTDVGFHFSPRWSSTSTAIQNQTKAPFIRVGYQTTSENIPYIIVKDKGLWTPDYNPEIYRGVNPGKTPSENVIALDQIGPNRKYTNRYEGKGNSSYSTTNGNSINLSKNVEAPVRKNEPVLIKPQQKTGPVIKISELGQLSLQKPSGIFGDRWDYDLNMSVISQKIHPDIIDEYIKPFVKKGEELYNSKFYRDRLSSAGITDVKEQDKIISEIIKNISNVDYYSVPLNSNARAQTYDHLGKHIVEFNDAPRIDGPLPYDVIHEVLGHVGKSNIPIITQINKKLIGPAPIFESNQDYINYLFKTYSQGGTEAEGQFMPAIYQMYRQGLTGEQLLASKYAKTDPALENYRFIKGDKWVANILDKLLSITPIVGTAGIGYNNLTNNE